MPDLDIRAAGAHRYDATVTAEDGTPTEHTVHVPPELLVELGVTEAQEPLLVRASLLYLLERESASSVLADFSLGDIAQYFPGYPTEIAGWV
jgi:hypothetical protein